ncbi:MAG: hypothetical protein ACRDBM_05295 [Sporomusa sp.]
MSELKKQSEIIGNGHDDSGNLGATPVTRPFAGKSVPQEKSQVVFR